MSDKLTKKVEALKSEVLCGGWPSPNGEGGDEVFTATVRRVAIRTMIRRLADALSLNSSTGLCITKK